MYTVPRTRPGQWAMWLLLVVAAYPLYWSVTLLIPESWRAVRLERGWVETGEGRTVAAEAPDARG